MRQLIWLDSAINDLVRLRKFTAQENPKAAKRAAEAIKAAAHQLAHSPTIGRPIAELEQYRDLLIRFGVGGYVLRYRIYLDIIYVVHIRHYRELEFKTTSASALLE